MSMGAVYASMGEVVKRLRLNMPVVCTIHDPITGNEVRIERENLLGMLVIDTPNLVLDSQWLAAMYMEMARARRACERASAHAERDFVRWKAEVSAEARRKSDKKLTNDEAAEAYRTHPDYERRAAVSAYYKTLSDLFEDAMNAFQLKAKMVDAQSRMLAGDFRAKRVEDRASAGERESDWMSEDLSERAAAALDTLAGSPVVPPMPTSTTSMRTPRKT
jgi:hypothetical protein